MLRNRGAQHVLLLVVLLILSLSGVVACGQSAIGSATTPTQTKPSTATIASEGQPSEIIITAKEYSFDLPQTVRTCLVDLTLMNTGKLPHGLGLILLNSDVSFDQFQSALLNKGLLVMRTLGTIMGWPNVAAPGKSSEIMLNLPTGKV